MSASCTIVDLRRWRIRLGLLVPNKCRLPEWARITLPVDVTLNRLAAPRCVFSFNFLFFFNVSSIFPNSVPRSIRSFAGTLRRGSRRFFRSQQRQQNVRFHARPEFYQSMIDDFFQQAVHLRPAHVLVRHFPAAMKNHRFHFKALA
jgi:hypothetical protein